MELTEQQLAEIEERERNASCGPWWYQESSDAYTHIVRGVNGRFITQLGQSSTGQAGADARFIANARLDVRALTREVRRLRSAGQQRDEAVYVMQGLLLTDGHSTTCQFSGCNCGKVTAYKVARAAAMDWLRTYTGKPSPLEQVVPSPPAKGDEL